MNESQSKKERDQDYYKKISSTGQNRKDERDTHHVLGQNTEEKETGTML